jgi:hypothetical protein
VFTKYHSKILNAVAYLQILLQKWAMRARGGRRELLEAAAHYALPSKGWFGSTAIELCASYAKQTSATGSGEDELCKSAEGLRDCRLC